MERVFFVLRSRGLAWDDSKPLEGQTDWAAHASANPMPVKSVKTSIRPGGTPI